MNIPSDLKYTPNDEWNRVEGNVGPVGITDFAQNQLSDIVFVVAESTVVKQGTNRILVELPGVSDQARARQLICKTALLEFKLLDETNSLEEALKGAVPPGIRSSTSRRPTRRRAARTARRTSSRSA